MARTPIDTPDELRKRIQKCNYTVGQLMQEMAATHGTPRFIDWSSLITKVKVYRDELETELMAKHGLSVKDVLPEASPTPTSEMTDDDFDDEIPY